MRRWKSVLMFPEGTQQQKVTRFISDYDARSLDGLTIASL